MGLAVRRGPLRIRPGQHWAHSPERSDSGIADDRPRRFKNRRAAVARRRRQTGSPDVETVASREARGQRGRRDLRVVPAGRALNSGPWYLVLCAWSVPGSFVLGARPSGRQGPRTKDQGPRTDQVPRPKYQVLFKGAAVS